MTIKNNLLSEYKDRISKLREDQKKLEELKESEKGKIDELHAISEEMENEMSDLLESFDKTKEEIMDDIENPEKSSESENNKESEDKAESDDIDSSNDNSDIEDISENDNSEDKILDEEVSEEHGVDEDLNIRVDHNKDAISITVENGEIQETSDLIQKRELFEKDGIKPKSIKVKLAFAHIGTNLNLFTFIEEELIKAMPTVSGVTGSGIPIQWGHETRDPRSTVGWTYNHEYENGTAYAWAEITNPEAIEMLLRDELRFCSMGCWLTPICSICGRMIFDKKCPHIRGNTYKKDGKEELCTIIGKDITFDHIGFTNFPADPLATVKQLAIASKQLDDLMQLKVNNSNEEKKEDVNMSDLPEDSENSEILEKLGELAAKLDTLTISEEEIVSTAEKVSDIKLENEKLKEENEQLKQDLEKAKTDLEDLQKVNHEKIVSAVLEAEKKIKKDLDVDARKDELSEKSDEVLAALAEGLSHVKIEEKKEPKSIPNSDTPGKEDKSFADMSPAERRAKFSFEEICEKLSKLGE